jgi:diketogulonate reductase-like aldo/keto reductase
MAYSPIGQGELPTHPTVIAVAKRHGVTPAQIALAWVIRRDHVIAIPKAATVEHVRENRGALDIQLTALDLAALDTAFPPPIRKKPLEVV